MLHIKRSAVILLAASCIMMACSRNTGDNVFDSIKVLKPANNQLLSGLELERIDLDSVNTSGEGISFVTSDGEIGFYDNYFSWVYFFDSDGHQLSRKLGYGRSNNESIIKGPLTAAISQEGEFAICGSSGDFELFSKNLTIENRFLLTYEESNDDGSPTNYYTYSQPPLNVVSRLKDEKLYIGMTSEYPDFCFFDNPDKYIEEAYHLGVVDMKEKKALPMEIKGFPSVYKEDSRRFVSFDNIDFDFDNKGNLYLGFNADSLVYVFDTRNKPLHAFGVSGKNMDMSYNKIYTSDDMPKWEENLMDKGYYSWIEYIDETETLFRSYKKGSHSEYDGVQIYSSKGKLIGDCQVPKDLKVTGYIAPWYYSQIYSDDDSRLYLYRFKLD